MRNRMLAVFAAALFSLSFAGAVSASGGEGSGISADEALKKLTEGNTAFVEGKSIHPNADAKRIAETAEKGQHPFVTVLSCADSRVPLEVLFDQGIGDIFVVRVAGNVSDNDEIGTIDYGVEHLGTPLVVVLGHTKCGAVTAVTEGAHLEGPLFKLVDNIYPAVDKAKKLHPDLEGKALVPAAIDENVWQSIEDLIKGSRIIREELERKKIKVVGALYDIETGKVKWMGPHPQQEKLMKEEE